MKRILLVILSLVFLVSLNAQSMHGARAQGMGGAFSSLSNDASSLSWNPAGMSLFRANSGIVDYTSMYSGFCSDALGTGAIGYVHHVPGILSAGISADMLYSDIYSRNIIGLSVSRKLNKYVSLGLRGNIHFSSYNEDNFLYGDDDTPNDPFFDSYGYSQNAFGADLGALFFPVQNIGIGLFAKNIIQPNTALSDIDSKVPIRLRTGAYYKLHEKYTFTVDFEYISENLDGNQLSYFFGAETWQMSNTLGFRTGINPDQLTFGASYRNPNIMFLGIDYSFIYPLSKVGQENATSHKVSLSIGYISEERESKESYKPVELTIAEEIEVQDTVIEPEPIKEIPKPTANITISPAVLEIEELTQIYEEEPLVPVVFFDPSSSLIDPRFDYLLFVIAERIKNNPDITVHLYGYFDPRSESNENTLNIQRAEAVRNKLIEYQPEITDRVDIIRVEYQPNRERSGLGRAAPTQQEQDMINQENRRVEFRASINTYAKTQFDIDNISAASVYGNYKEIIDRNPDIDIIIEGGGKDEDFSKAFSFENDLLQTMPKSQRERVFVSLGGKDNQHYCKLNVDGVIYRPRGIRNNLESSNIEHEAIIDISTTSEDGFAEYRIDIVDEAGTVFRTIEQGSGVPKKTYSWNWTDENGNLLDSRETYYAVISATDNYDNYVEAKSDDAFVVKITEKEIIRSRLLIVQFIYDAFLAQSIYLEDRLEYVTRKLIEYAQENKEHLTIEIAGHTDVLGTPRRNQELSVERATTEYDNIKKYLIEILDLENETALNQWLKENNTTIKPKGYGPSKPYQITRWKDGVKREITLGDNSKPEGRTINRRVLIDMTIEKSHK